MRTAPSSDSLRTLSVYRSTPEIGNGTETKYMTGKYFLDTNFLIYCFSGNA